MPELIDSDRLLVLASGNAGKLKELSSMLTPLGWTVRSQGDWKISEAVEDGQSFIENALIKARHAARGTGLPALGDDSGLLVDALRGKPGLYSARYAGTDADDQKNNKKLLAELQGVPGPDRTAYFYCAMVFVRYADDPAPLISTGRWLGRILKQARGEGGFGYDPLFWVPGKECSSAELSPQTKNCLSHRGQALAVLAAQMKDE
jgi:XTP/dITP diphosphohydrolase